MREALRVLVTALWVAAIVLFLIGAAAMLQGDLLTGCVVNLVALAAGPGAASTFSRA